MWFHFEVIISRPIFPTIGRLDRSHHSRLVSRLKVLIDGEKRVDLSPVVRFIVNYVQQLLHQRSRAQSTSEPP